MSTSPTLAEPTKRFVVFASPSYYPACGWNDFVSSHDTFEEAEKKRASVHDVYSLSHIVDLTLGKIVIDQFEHYDAVMATD